MSGVSKVLWLNWLRGRSVFTRFPALVYLIPYILGGVLWRLGQIRWEWQERELRVLPYGLILCALTLYILRPLWWRFAVLVCSRPGYLLCMVAILAAGYFYPAYRYQRLVPPLVGEVQVLGRVLAIEGQGVDETWTVRPVSLHFETAEPSRITLHGKLQIRQPLTVSASTDDVTPPGISLIQVGDTVVLTGDLQEFSHATNPGEFDYARYQRYEGFVAQLWQPRVELVSRPGFSISSCFFRGRQAAEEYFSRTLQIEHQPLVLALLTGETDYLSESELEQIRSLGLSHLLAISGLHLGFVVTWVRRLLKWMCVPRRWQTAFLLTALWCAVLFVGARPSALRVGIFLTFVEAGALWHRRLEPLNLLAVTAWIILLLNPLTLYLLSFQLSFLVYLAILVFYQPLQQRLCRLAPSRPELAHKLFAAIASALALSLAAFAGSLPVVLFQFYQVPLWGIGMNLWAVPLTGILLALILIDLMCGLLWFQLGQTVASLLDFCVGGFRWLIQFFASFKSGLWQPGRPLLIWIMLFVLVCWLGWWLSERRGMPVLWRRRRVSMVLCMLVVGLLIWAATLWFPLPRHGLEWVVLDVGQGDGMFLQLPQGEIILLDGGGTPTGANYTGERIIKPFLLSRGISRINLVCITHFDADHVRGLLPVLREFAIGSIWAPAGSESAYWAEVQRIAHARKIPIYNPEQGEQVQIGPVRLEVLNPVPGKRYAKENDRSLVLRLSVAGMSLLLTGDLGATGEQELLRSGLTLTADFLKVGHHGSKSSTLPEFLNRVSPKYGVISVGQNRYGHPTVETLERLRAKGATLLRTDELGALRIYYAEGRFQLQSFNRISQKNH